MIELILSLLGTNVGKTIVGALALSAALLGFRLKSVSDGVKKEQAKQASRDLEIEKEVSNVLAKIGTEIANDTDAAGTIDRLHNGKF